MDKFEDMGTGWSQENTNKLISFCRRIKEGDMAQEQKWESWAGDYNGSEQYNCKVMGTICAGEQGI